MNKIIVYITWKNIPKLATSCKYLRVIVAVKSFKVRAISDLRHLYGNKIQGPRRLDSNFCNLYDWFLGRKYWYYSKDPVKISISAQFGLLDELLELMKVRLNSSNFKSAMTLKLQEVANFEMLFHVMQIKIVFMFVCNMGGANYPLPPHPSKK